MNSLDPAIVIWCSVAAMALLLGVVHWLGARFGIGWQWLRADPELRPMIRTATRIRRTWPQVAHRLGLARPVNPNAAGGAGRGQQRGRPTKMEIPRIARLEVSAFGADVHIDTILGVGRAEIAAQAGYLADHWKADKVRVAQPESGHIIARALVREPLDVVVDSPLIDAEGNLTVEPGSLSCHDDILLGYTEDGDPVTLNLAKTAHGVIQGVTRSGKSITVNTLLAHASLMRDVRLVIIDPNLGAVAPWWRTAYRVSSDVAPDGPTALLEELREEMYKREAYFWAQRTDKISEFSPELPLYLLAIDEVSNYTNWSDKSAAAAFRSQLQAFASQAAKFGFRLWLLGQKLDATVLTTATRTNLTSRICHRVDTTEDFRHLFPDAADLDGLTAAERSLPQGGGIAAMMGMKMPVRMRSVYLSAESCWKIGDAIVAAQGQRRPVPGGAHGMEVLHTVSTTDVPSAEVREVAVTLAKAREPEPEETTSFPSVQPLFAMPASAAADEAPALDDEEGTTATASETADAIDVGETPASEDESWPVTDSSRET